MTLGEEEYSASGSQYYIDRLLLEASREALQETKYCFTNVPLILCGIHPSLDKRIKPEPCTDKRKGTALHHLHVMCQNAFHCSTALFDIYVVWCVDLSLAEETRTTIKCVYV